MARDTAPRGQLPDAPWVGALDNLCALLRKIPALTMPAVAATVRLNEVGGALRLVRACEELARRHELLLDVRRDPAAPSGTATFVVRIRRRATAGGETGGHVIRSGTGRWGDRDDIP